MRLRAGRIARHVAEHGSNIDPWAATALDPPAGPDATVAALVLGLDRPISTPRAAEDRPRADSIVWCADAPAADRRAVLTVPRDLGVEIPELGCQRLGWTYDFGGSPLLVAAVRDALGLPVHHVIAADFRCFAAVVDAVGGVNITLQGSIRDRATGADLHSGRHHLDGATTLAVVRSRHRDFEHGHRSPDSDGDAARRARLHDVIADMTRRTVSTRSPRTMLRIASAVRSFAVLDSTFGEVLEQTGRWTQRTDLAAYDLPAVWSSAVSELTSPFPPRLPTTTRHLVLDQPRAATLLRSLRADLDL